MHSPRRIPSRWLLTAIAGSLPFLVANPRALAESHDEPIVLEYRAPNGCETRAAFVAALRARSQRVREAAAGESARWFAIQIDQRAGVFSGTLRIRASGTETSRTLEAGSCSELVRALVLVALLAIDPQSAREPAATVATNSDAALAANAPAKTARAAPPPAAASPPAEAKTPFEVAGAEPEAVEIGLRASLGGGLFGGFTPEPLWAVRAGAEVERSNSAIFAPAVRLTFEYAAHGRVDVAGGSGHFRYAGGNLEACPLGFRAGAFLLRPCISASVALVHSWSSGVAQPLSASRPWADVGPEARLAWGAGPLRIELGFAWVFPLVRDRYLIAGQPFYRVPWAGTRSVLEVGYRFL